MRLATALAALLGLVGAAARADDFPAHIATLRIEGLRHTLPRIVQRELPWRPGTVVPREDWDLGIARLWNTGLFEQVDACLEGPADARTAVVRLAEHFTIGPLVSYGVSGGTGWFRLGAEESNLLGRFWDVAAEYERFGAENGGMARVGEPRLLDRRVGAWLSFERLARPRPRFVDFRTLGRLEISGESSDRLSFRGWFEAFSHRFQAPRDAPGELPPASAGARLGGEMKLGRVDIRGLRKQGASLAIAPSLAATSDPDHPVFAQLSIELLWLRAEGERWNFALRTRAATGTPAPLQHRFWLGGLELMRGYEDNHFRGAGYAAFNAEVRWTAWEGSWLAFVPAMFADGAAMRPDVPDAPRFGLAAGAGVRIIVPKFVEMGGRFDLAVPLVGERGLQPNLGVYQYF